MLLLASPFDGLNSQVLLFNISLLTFSIYVAVQETKLACVDLLDIEEKRKFAYPYAILLPGETLATDLLCYPSLSKLFDSHQMALHYLCNQKGKEDIIYIN